MLATIVGQNTHQYAPSAPIFILRCTYRRNLIDRYLVTRYSFCCLGGTRVDCPFQFCGTRFNRTRFSRTLSLSLTGLFIICGLTISAQSQTVKTIAQSVFSTAGFVSDSKGNLYSTMFAFGNSKCNVSDGYGGCGKVFELSPTSSGWALTTLYAFNGGTDGAVPTSGLVMDKEGNFYGTTAWGGGSSNCRYGCGTIFKLSLTSTGWQEKVVHAFTGEDGSDPTTLIIDENGDLFGITNGDACAKCATSHGTVYKLSFCSGQPMFEVLHTFPVNALNGPLARDAAGNLYGALTQGGDTSGNCAPQGCGLIFKLSPATGTWPEKVLHTFDRTDGALPNGLAFDSTFQNLYGTTYIGGRENWGNVFKINMPSGEFTVTYSFTGNSSIDGGNPSSGLVFDRVGNMYGSTSGGVNNPCDVKPPCGNVYKLSPGAKSVLATYTFGLAIGIPLVRPGGDIYLTGFDTFNQDNGEAFQIVQ